MRIHRLADIRKVCRSTRRSMTAIGTGAALTILALAGSPATVLSQGQAQGELPIETLNAGIHVIRAEVASAPQERATGMMFREAIAPNHGMLFVFPDKAIHCFWMRNTLIPLSIAFLADDGTIVDTADMQAHSEESHCPTRAVRYALEMEKGWFARRGLTPGARLTNKQLFVEK